MVLGITGGIGVGKSAVCKIFELLNCPVYDSDCQAKQLMDNSPRIKELLKNKIHPLAVSADGKINRPLIASEVFNSEAKLRELNSIVHTHVREDAKNWIEAHSNYPLLIIESAVLFQSNLADLTDSVIEVTAPRELRIIRVMQRNNLDESEVIRRIDSQQTEQQLCANNQTIKIINDGVHPILPQVEALFSSL